VQVKETQKQLEEKIENNQENLYTLDALLPEVMEKHPRRAINVAQRIQELEQRAQPPLELATKVQEAWENLEALQALHQQVAPYSDLANLVENRIHELSQQRK
jgi:formate dehydrogenase maturation protein FdhE